jgi:heptosyltransferase I
LRVLLIRLGAMGDVVHALPVAAAIRRSFSDAEIAWLIEPKWLPLLQGNPNLNRAIPLNRRSWTSIRSAYRQLQDFRADVTIDLQGLIKSGLSARMSGAADRIGFDARSAREPISAMFYTKPVFVAAQQHAVEKGLHLAAAFGANLERPEFWLPSGEAEGELPNQRYVLASPFAGWNSKQWPLESYRELAIQLADLGLPLVLNVAPAQQSQLASMPNTVINVGALPGLFYATRNAAAVVGVDSGPLHLAAAMNKSGVAIFGPTDPQRNGPFGGNFTVLRTAGAETTYRREEQIAESMKAITAKQVLEALVAKLENQSVVDR